MRRWMCNVLTAVTIMLFSSLPVFAVTAWWLEPGILVEADEAITPSAATGQPLPGRDTNNTLSTARPLRVGAAPLDGVIVAGAESWYVLVTEDGPGYIRIGSTGPLLIEDTTEVSARDSAPGAWSRKSVAPKNDAKLIETSMISVTDVARIRQVKRAFIRLSTSSATPVAYRMSFVSELPENRVGSAYGPAVAANQYILALANQGPLNDLYRTSRIRYTKEQAIALREKLFGKTDPPSQFFNLHEKEAFADPNVTEALPVQHIILSDDQSRHWAFVVTCEQRDGLWVVTDARRDPGMTEKEVAGIIRRDEERSANFRTGEVPKPIKPPASTKSLTAPKPKAR